LPLDKVNDYTIKAKVEYVSGQINNGYGIVWGMKDWDNYNYFVVSPNGYYMIGSKWDGISSQSEWKYSKSVSQKQNNLTIKKLGDKIYYAINGTVVESDDYVLLHGAEIGLYNTASKTVRLKSLEVDQEFTLNDLEKLLDKYTESNSNSSTESSSTASDWMGNGTGFFIDRTGYIATNYHVVDGAKDIEVEFIRNGVKQVYSAEVIQSDKHNDLSILKINSPSFKPFDYIPYNFKLAISEVGSNVFALGYPMALSLMGTEIKFTDGKISSKTGMQGDITTYQISVPIQPGNSGGPLFDYDGNLVGITSSSINRGLDITENVNYAIKTSYLKSLIEILPVGLNLPSYNSISNKTLTEKIKVISDYVVLIKVR
jgi:S1-C subfamily serine protease